MFDLRCKGSHYKAAQWSHPNLPRRCFVFTVLAGVTAVLIMMALASPFPRLFFHMAIEELNPATISWEGKTAWKRCDSAIAGRTSWPQSPQSACAAMHLCVNEAPLSEPQKQQLSQLIHYTPGCPEP